MKTVEDRLASDEREYKRAKEKLAEKNLKDSIRESRTVFDHILTVALVSVLIIAAIDLFQVKSISRTTTYVPQKERVGSTTTLDYLSYNP